MYNICLEKAVTVKRYIEITAAALEVNANIKFLPVEEMLIKCGKSADERGLRFFAEHMCYDIRKAREQIGFAPLITTREAIEQTAVWASCVLKEKSKSDL